MPNFLQRWVKLKRFYAILIIFLFVFFLLSRGVIYEKDELEYGITFSKRQADSLGLDWKEVFTKSLDELQIRKYRLSAYWDEVEVSNGTFEWDFLDWQVEEASKRGAEIILAAGSRLPRWPECHFPEWVKLLEKNQRETETLEYIEEVIERYKDNQNMISWQIENEPFLAHFGECPELDPEFLDKEIALVKSIDTRPIIVTDSGELSVWVPAAKRADVFGTTMYRDTYSNLLKAYVHYPIEPGFFRFKKNIAGLCAKPDNWIVIELQAEPWGPIQYQEMTKEDRDRTMSIKKFIDIIDFSSKTGFNEFYLWGVEWWYWEKTTQNNPEFWNEAKKLFKN